MPKPPRALVFIFVTLGIDALGFGIVVPIVPDLVRTLSGLPASEAAEWVGAMVAIFSFATFLFSPLLGALSDRFGRRPVLLASIGGVAINYLMLATAPTLLWLFLGRFIAGGTAANVSTASAYIADITPPERRAARFGLIGASFGFGFVFGPAIGGLLGSIDLRLPFLVAAGLAGCNFLFGVLVLPESLPRDKRRAFQWGRANPVGAISALTRDHVLAWLALAWSCMWFSLGALQSSFVLSNGIRFDWGPHQNGLALALVGLSQALVQTLLIRRAVGALGERRAALTGFAISACAYTLLALAPFGWLILVAVVVQAFGAISNPSVRALVSARAGPERQGEVLGVLASVEGLTAIVSPLLGAWVFGQFARADAPIVLPGAAFLLAVAAYAIAAFAVMVSTTGARAAQPPETAAVAKSASASP